MKKASLICIVFYTACIAHAGLIELPTFTTDTAQAADVLQNVDSSIQKKNWGEALVAIERGLIDFPEHPDLLARAGHVYTMTEQFDLAEQYWAKLVEKYPDNAWAHACRGGLLLRMNRAEEAERELKQSLTIDSTLLVARYHLACIQLKKNDMVSAQHMLTDLSVYDIGRLMTWLRDENETLISIVGEKGYRTLCAIVAGRDEDTNFPEASALKPWADHIATLLWKSYQAEQQEAWTTVIEFLEQTKQVGITAPSLQIKIEKCRAMLHTDANGAGRL